MTDEQKLTRAVCMSVSAEALAIVDDESKSRNRSRSYTISEIVTEWHAMAYPKKKASKKAVKR